MNLGLVAATIELLFAIISFYISQLDYNTFIKYIEYLINCKITAEQLTNKYIPLSKWHTINLFLIITGNFFSAISFISYVYYKKIDTLLKSFFLLIKNTLVLIKLKLKLVFKNIKSPQILFLISVLFPNICWLFFYPIEYDEALTYFYFTSRPFWLNLVWYPEPNNHVLYSLLTHIAIFLPFEPIITMRMISLTGVFFISICILYYYRNDKIIGYITVLVLLSLFPVLYYSFQARGYMLYLLFAWISWVLVQKIINNYYPQEYIVILIICLVAGTYTIPTFIYIVTVYFIFLLINANNKICIIKLNIIAFALIILLYIPIIIVNDLINNPFIASENKPITVTVFCDYSYRLISYFFCYNSSISIFLFFILIFYAIYNRNIIINQLSIFSCLLPILVIIIQQILPPERVWIFLSIPISLILADIIKLLSKKFGNKTVIIILYLNLLGAHVYVFQFFKEEIYQGYHRQYIFNMFNEPAYFYLNEAWSPYILHYYMNYKGLQYKKDLFSEYNPDNKYDYLVLFREGWKAMIPTNLNTEKYVIHYQDKQVTIWKNKNKEE